MLRGLSRRLGGQPGELGWAKRPAVVFGALVLALAVYVVAELTSGHHGDAALFLLVVPMTLATFAYGLPGGAGSAAVGAALATAWWVERGYPGGAAWYGSRIVTYVLLGLLLGWLVDSRRALQSEAERHWELSLDVIVTANFDGYFTRVNPAFTRMLGYSSEELMKRPFLDFVHPDDITPTLEEVARQTERGEEVLRFQNRYRHKDGSYRWLEWTSHPDPASRSLVAVARDVTERKELERREHEYKSALEQAVRERTAELQRRNRELEDAKHETLQRLAVAAEFRDDETHRHTERVGKGAAQVAAQLGMSDREIELIRQAAPLHDVGKLGVSDSILLKPGKLTPEEFDRVKTHATCGAAILAGSNSDVLQMAEEIALHHHEWWDGSGYPQGLKGEQIPLSGRIVAVIDVFDALIHTRPYKEAWPIAEAVDEIHRLSGRQFDPHVVEAFMQLDPAELAGLPTRIGLTKGLRSVA